MVTQIRGSSITCGTCREASVARVVDNISGNYNYKMGVCRVKKIGGTEYQKEFHSFSFAPRNIVV